MKKRINETWWCAAKDNVCIWPYLELRRTDVIERLKMECRTDLRIVKLQVSFLPVPPVSFC